MKTLGIGYVKGEINDNVTQITNAMQTIRAFVNSIRYEIKDKDEPNADTLAAYYQTIVRYRHRLDTNLAELELLIHMLRDAEVEYNQQQEQVLHTP